jgi:ion channel-forming bestrophin family protein
MYIKRKYGFLMTLQWSKKPLIYSTLYATFITIAYHFLKFEIALPIQAVSILGVAVAFYLGFKNNSSYDRTWEARKIWGGIVNSSRTFGAAVITFIQNNQQEELHKTRKSLIYRHIAWLTALRYQLRLAREWEHTEDRNNELYNSTVCEAYFSKLDQELLQFISAEELAKYKTKTNIATQILATQAQELQKLRNLSYFDDFRHIEFHKLIALFYEDQGKSERIKNFPFPRQYSSAAVWITLIFCALLPFGLLDTFDKEGFIWLTIPFSGIVTWVFFLMEMIGDYSENPFEGTYNDVPITTISRGIEIDMREMLGDSNIPKPIAPENGFAM